MASAEELEMLLTLMTRDRISRYLSLSAIVFILYDIVINLAREYQFVWKSRWGVVKVLYYVSRYWALVYLIFLFVVHLQPTPSIQLCTANMWIDLMAGDVVFTTAVNVLLVLRIHALYGQSRKVLIALIALVIMEFVFETYTDVSLLLRSAVYTPPPGLPWQACELVISHDSMLKTLTAWVPCLFVATIFFVMTMFKFVGLIRRGNYSFLKDSTSLLYVFIKDGTIYFLLTFCIVLLGTIIIMVPSTASASAGPLDWLVAIYSLSGSRLVLNLRSAAANGRLDFSLSVSEISAMRVAVENSTETDSEIELEGYRVHYQQ